MIARAGLALVAVAALVWLGTMERDTRFATRGAKALEPGATAAELRRAEGDLHAAQRWNPDTQPRSDLALVHRARGDVPRALATMEGVVRDEPDNLVAWGVLSLLARGNDAATEARAQAAFERLDPVRARRARRAAP